MLKEDGNLSGGLIHLHIDGVDVGPAYTVFELCYGTVVDNIPDPQTWISDNWQSRVPRRILMGRPNGQGDSVNPVLPRLNRLSIQRHRPHK